MTRLTVSLGRWTFPLIWPLLLLLFAAFAVAGIAVYFSSLRPRKGTIEWIARLDRPHFSAPCAAPFRARDVAYLLLCALLGASVAFARAQLGTSAVHAAALLSAAALAAGMYLLLRSLFGQTLTAVCGAVCAALLQSGTQEVALCFAFWFLFRWIGAPADRSVLPRGLWLTLSAAAMCAALLLYPSAAWLLPLWPAAYIFTQVVRWRHGDPSRRGRRLALSLFLTVLLGGVCALTLCAVHVNRSGQMPDGFAVLRSLRFYRTLPTTLCALFSGLTAPCSLRLPHDACLLLCIAAAAVCALHGACRLRESRCVLLLVTAAAFPTLWLMGGTFLPAVPTVLLLGWMWKVCATRGHAFFVILFAAAILLLCGVTIFIA